MFLEANYERNAEKNPIANLRKNRVSYNYLFFIRNAAPFIAFGYNETYFTDGVFLDSIITRLGMNITQLKFIPYV